jgi:hypothetical protein
VANREGRTRTQQLTRVISSLVRPDQVRCHLQDFYSRDNGASQLWDARPSPVRYGTPASLQCSVKLLCSRLLGLDLAAMGRGLGTTGYASAQIWCHAEFEGVSLDHVADLDCMLHCMVDSQPPHLDGAAKRWLQGVM